MMTALTSQWHQRLPDSAHTLLDQLARLYGCDYRPAMVGARLHSQEACCLVIERDKRVVGLVVAHLIRTSSQSASAALRAVTRGSGAAEIDDALNGSSGSVLVVRNAQESRVMVDPALSDADERRILAHAIDSIVERAREFGARRACLTKVGSDQRALTSHLIDARWARYESGGSAHVDLRCLRTFDDYLSTLPAARRREVLREIRVFEKAGLHLMSGPVDDAVLREVASLEANHHERYETGWDADRILTRRREWSAALGDSLQLLSCMRDDRRVGSLLYVREQERWEARSVGFDYPAVDRTFAYFNMVFYWMIRAALEARAQTVDFGHDALQAKVARGARVIPSSMFVSAVIR
ncbi:peptidogalycan biosysnthesis protein [Streptomyces sp. NPDC046985]|uniref:peptidogalycan biosysnthesis protein n=1 Tax=Streptomyces sp. NPDC046985 TaxID=3155377 RepID=UPI0033D839CC